MSHRHIGYGISRACQTVWCDTGAGKFQETRFCLITIQGVPWLMGIRNMYISNGESILDTFCNQQVYKTTVLTV